MDKSIRNNKTTFQISLESRTIDRSFKSSSFSRGVRSSKTKGGQSGFLKNHTVQFRLKSDFKHKGNLETCASSSTKTLGGDLNG